MLSAFLRFSGKYIINREFFSFVFMLASEEIRTYQHKSDSRGDKNCDCGSNCLSSARGLASLEIRSRCQVE